MRDTYVIFKKLPTVSIRPFGENSPNTVTLLANKRKKTRQVSQTCCSLHTYLITRRKRCEYIQGVSPEAGS
jgi:hypothetical protein